MTYYRNAEGRNYANYPSRTIVYREDVPFIKCDDCHRHYTTDARRIHYDENGLKFVSYVPVNNYVIGDGFGKNHCVDVYPCLKLKEERTKEELAMLSHIRVK